MTAPVRSAPATSSAGPTAWTRGRWRGPALWTLLVIIVTVLVTLISVRQASNTQASDPQNPGRNGAQALAEVLSHHGVEVQVVRSEEAFLGEPIGSDTTVLITNTDELSGQGARRALDHARSAARLVLLTPPQATLDGMQLPLEAVPHATYQEMTAGCASPDVRSDERLSEGEVRYESRAGSTATICFPPDPDVAASSDQGGYYVTLVADGARPAVSVIGSPAVIANKSITTADQGALALRSLGHSPRLLWYAASFTDIAAGDPSAIPPLMPGWFVPALAIVGMAVLLLMFWRGRRLGRLATEPLPVIVRAIETTESRGRLYRKAQDRERAHAVLQRATRERLTAYLGLSPGTPPADLAAALAAATGRQTDEILHLLAAPIEPHDAALLHTAGQLAQLEEDLRR